MGETILEREIKFLDKSTGETKIAFVKIYPDKVVIKKGDEIVSILIPYINVLVYRYYQALNYLIAAIATFVFALIMYLMMPASLLPEIPIKEIVVLFSFLIAIALLIAWFYYQSHFISINSFGYNVEIWSNKETEIKEIFETLEKLRSQRVGENLQLKRE
ncbi:MAG: hypothetical protein NZ879_06310 [Archaeoglobaceae archaeon]|nr:hypothetical protein [Archaeoglobaceae archaeon]MDW8118579.1 hypothetical protein [Archaeoglobaceae archaeon]